MKKAVALLLVLVMVFALCACGAKSNDPVVGTWKLSGLMMGEEDYSSFVSMFDMQLTFKADGTGTMVYDGDTVPLTWKSGSFTDGTDTFNYTMVGDTIQFEAEGMTFIFSRV